MTNACDHDWGVAPLGFRCSRCDAFRMRDSFEADMPREYALDLRKRYPGITDAGINSYWRARHLPTD